jgi:hypothetical protein
VTNEGNSANSILKNITITGNTTEGVFENQIIVRALSGNVSNVVIGSNSFADNASVFACILRADASYTLATFVLSGNVFKTTGVSNIYCLGDSSNISNGIIIGNHIMGGTNGIRLLQTSNIVETGNYNTATKKVLLDTGSTNAILDRRQSVIVTMTSATYTVEEQDDFLIANRAGTVTVTLPTAATSPGRELSFKTVQAQSVVSAASNVVPIGDTTAATTILGAVDGAWAKLKSDGTNWIIVQS